MKVTSVLTIACFLIFSTISSSSCKKIIDEIKKNPGNGVASDCRIDKVIATAYLQYENIPDTAYFSYNAAGNPIKITHSTRNELPEDVPNIVLKYDKQNRLIAYLVGYERDTVNKVDKASGWSTYEYIGRNIVKRKGYQYASASYSAGDPYTSIKNQPENYAVEDTDTLPTFYELDDWDRIKRKTAGSTVTNYNYDASGNLVEPGATYGSNIRYHQTNKVWMFLCQDYSVNLKTAPLIWYTFDEFPLTFNSKKLPTTFRFYPGLFNVRIGSAIGGETIQMQYICK